MSQLFDKTGKFSTARVEAFSDAVMAVAITLMVLRIEPPAVGSGRSVAEAFWNDTLPDIIFFLITFVVIVLFWRHHHDAFRELPREMPSGALWLNTGFLACICLIPFGLEFFTQDGSSMLTVGVYAGFMSLATLFLGALDRLAVGHWHGEVIIGAVVFLLAIPLAPLLGAWCLIVWWLDVPFGRLLNRWRARHRPAT